MASTDAHPIPKKNTAFRVIFPVFDKNGVLLAGAAFDSGLGSGTNKAWLSIDQGAAQNSTNNITAIGAGTYYLDLTTTEMNSNCTLVLPISTTTDARTTPLVLYPQATGDVTTVLEASQPLFAPAKPADIFVTPANKLNTDGSGNVILATSQPNYAPAKAGDAMTLTTGERSSVATAVWANGTRDLTAYGSLVSDIWSAATRSLTDKAGFSLTSGERSSIASAVWANSVRDLTDKTGFELIAAYDPAKTAMQAGATVNVVKQDVRDALALSLTVGVTPTNASTEAQTQTASYNGEVAYSYDVVNNNTAYPNGTDKYPVSTFGALDTIITATGIKRVAVISTSLVLDTTMSNTGLIFVAKKGLSTAIISVAQSNNEFVGFNDLLLQTSMVTTECIFDSCFISAITASLTTDGLVGCVFMNSVFESIISIPLANVYAAKNQFINCMFSSNTMLAQGYNVGNIHLFNCGGDLIISGINGNNVVLDNFTGTVEFDTSCVAGNAYINGGNVNVKNNGIGTFSIALDTSVTPLSAQKTRDAMTLTPTSGGTQSIDNYFSFIPSNVASYSLTELAADPGTNPQLGRALMLLYMALRNAETVTSSARTIKNNAGTTILTQTLSDDGTTFTKSKVA